MKSTFFKLPLEKQVKIREACIAEFGEHGYEKATTDRIIGRIGISKGGLYEYIENKEDLYLYIIEFVYQKLYHFIKEGIDSKHLAMPEDILERFRLVSSIAIDFYLDYPEMIRVITKTMQITDPELLDKVHATFAGSFGEIFGNIASHNLQYDLERVMDLLKWLLVKTREEFLSLKDRNSDIAEIKEIYRQNWEFYLSVLKRGIYRN